LLLDILLVIRYLVGKKLREAHTTKHSPENKMKNFNRSNSPDSTINNFIAADREIVWTPEMAAAAKAKQAERFATSSIPVK